MFAYLCVILGIFTEFPSEKHSVYCLGTVHIQFETPAIYKKNHSVLISSGKQIAAVVHV